MNHGWWQYQREINIRPFGMAADAVIIKDRIVGMIGKFLQTASDTKGMRIMGRALRNANNIGGIDGQRKALVIFGLQIAVNTVGLDEDDIGHAVYIIDDRTVGRQEATVNKITAGILFWVDPEINKGVIQP